MKKQRLLFAISQFYKGGAEVSLLNLLKKLDREKYDIDFLVLNQQPVRGAVSLIPDLPEHIRVFDAFREDRSSTFRRRVQRKLLCSENDLADYPSSALFFVRGRQYDWAFHIGEWWSPAFVAFKVRAQHKAIWIHTDIAAANSFRADDFFSFDDFFDRYLFVSQLSLESAVDSFPFLENRSLCIHNISDSESILAKSHESVDLPSALPRPIVLTCANIRPEKNHMRQLHAMKLLRDQGMDFTWVNIGSTADSALTYEILQQAAEYGLQDRFLFLGSRDNPYPYIADADVIAVLSDYESWSMVITEAMTLGVPVIATKTSGALEQIEDGVNGILTDFDAFSIAKKLEPLLLREEYRQSIRQELRDFSTRSIHGVLDAFSALISAPDAPEKQRGLLYVIDDINYRGGAHIATINQLRALSDSGRSITVFSASLPCIRVRNDLPRVRFISWTDCDANKLFHRRFTDCILDPSLPLSQKLLKAKMTWASKIRKNHAVFEKYVQPDLVSVFSGFDTACVMSESSPFRAQIADAAIRRKIQYIHTDYAAWKNFSAWTQKMTADDERIYGKFDCIVLLSDSICDRFNALYPSLSGKTTVNRNCISCEEIRKKSIRKPPVGHSIRFVTVGRVDSGKGYDRMLRVLEHLWDDGYSFEWTIIGSGVDFREISASFTYSRIADRVRLLGALDNPYPFMREADVFALFSYYEGLPNTIYESLILGVPVIATNVGGIASQITPGENGWLVPSSEKGIYDGLAHILTHPEEVCRYRENLKEYTYDNDSINTRTESILYGDSLFGQDAQ